MEESNESLQADEVLALSSIFENDWIVEDSVQGVYSIKIFNSAKNNVHLQVTLVRSYPLESPPIYEISAPWMSRVAKKNLCSALEDVYCQNIGDCIIYLWIETIRNFISDDSFSIDNTKSLNNLNETESLESETLHSACKINALTFDELPSVEHGDTIVDRKSVFQAHIARVVSVKQVDQVLQKLKENKKIASATHNIFAYRIAQGNIKTFIQDCEDDGETKAGSTLLHLLQIVDVCDVLVVVSRWYGGIHLGSDRFKHINNAARNLLNQLGYISEKPQISQKKSQKR